MTRFSSSWTKTHSDEIGRHFRRQLMPLFLMYFFAFPLGMLWVETRPLNGPTVCVFRQVTHLDCPSCGLTRAFRAMGQLDVGEAFRYNPLGPVFFAIAVLFWVYAVGMLLTHGRITLPHWWQRWKGRVFWIFVCVYLVVGMGRIIYQLQHPPPPPKPMATRQWFWPVPPFFLRN